MTKELKEMVGELSGLSAERQQVAARVIHALWSEDCTGDSIHPEWKAELDRRNTQIASGEIELVSESSMDTFVTELLRTVQELRACLRSAGRRDPRQSGRRPAPEALFLERSLIR